jgi:hypothetical protein
VSTTPIAGRPTFPPTPNQQSAYEQQLAADRGNPLPPEQSQAAADLILRSAAKARGEVDPDEDPEQDRAPEEDETVPKQNKRKARDNNDKGDDDDRNDDDEEAAARARERSRVKAIMHSPAGLANPPLAAVLAFETAMPRGEAIELLNTISAMTARHPDELRNRMAAQAQPNVGLDGKSGGHDMSTPQGVANFIVAMNERRLGKTP